MSQEIVKEIFKESSSIISRGFRFLIPGFVFLLFYDKSFSGKPRGSLLNIADCHPYICFFFLLLSGMAIYQIHRCVFWYLDECLFWYFGREDCWTFFKKRYGKSHDDNLPVIVSYMEHRWSIIHSCLIMSELAFIFSWIAEKDSIVAIYKACIMWLSVLFFLICMGLYLYLSYVEVKHLRR